MKKLFRITPIVLLICLIVAPIASAQYDFSMSVGINVVNLDASNEATIMVSYYTTGTEAPTQVSDTIPAGGSVKYFPVPVADGFNGSAVISSNREIAAIVNEISSGYGGSYNGFSEGSTSFFTPIIMRANGGYDTEISIQNAGSTSADVDVSFAAGTYGSDYDMPTFSIDPSRAYRVYQGDQTQLGTRFVGSAHISATQPIVVVVNQINNTNRTLLVYGGSSTGYNRVAVPQVQHANSGYNTGIQVQNVDSTRAATITVTYGPNVAPGGTAFTPGTQTATNIASGQTAVFNQWGNKYGYDWDAAARYVGAATVTTTEGDVPLVVNVNVLKGTAPAQAAAYEGINADSTSTSFSAPILMSNNGGFSTSCLVLNTSTTQEVTATMSYVPNTGAGISYSPEDEQFQLATGGSNQFRQFPTLGQWADPAKNNGQRWLGSGTIQATGPVAVVCNQLNFTATSSDGLMSYDAFSLD